MVSSFARMLLAGLDTKDFNICGAFKPSSESIMQDYDGIPLSAVYFVRHDGG